MWFDAAPGAADASPRGAHWIAIAGAAFSFPVVLFALAWLEPAAANAASAFGLG